MAYVRRVKFEARMHAMAMVEVLDQALGGKKQGRLKNGKVFENVSTVEGLKRMGVDI